MPVVDLGGVAVLAADPAGGDHASGQAHARRDQVVVDFGIGGVVPHRAIHRRVHRIGAATVVAQHMPDLMQQHRPGQRNAPPLVGAQHCWIYI
jgi:hypothetical protein